MKTKIYTIAGRKFYQRKFTLNQSEAMMDLIAELKELDGEISAAKILKALAQKQLLTRAMGILLIPEGESQSVRELTEEDLRIFGECPMDIVEKVIADFFDINGAWLKSLRNSLNGRVKMNLRKTRTSAG